MITQLTGSGYGGRRYGSFAGREEVVVIVPDVAVNSGGYLYPMDRPARVKKFRAKDEDEQKAKRILEDIAENLDPVYESSQDYELILRLRLREQGLIYKALYLTWINRQAEYRKAEEQRIEVERRKKKKRKMEDELIILAYH